MNNKNPDLERDSSAPTALAVRSDSLTPAPLGFNSYQNYESATSEQKVHLREYWRIVKRRRRLVVLVLILGTMLGILISFHQKSIYKSAVIIEVGKNNPTLIRMGDAVVSTTDYDLKTAIQQLQSRPLAQAVIRELKLDQNRNFFDVAEGRSLGETLKAVVGNINAPNSDRKIIAGIFEPKADEEKLIEALTHPVLTPEEQGKIGIILSNLAVTQIRDSRLLKIEYSHTDPVLASAIANSLAKTYIDTSFRAKTDKYSKTSDWLDRTTRGMKAKVEQAEQELVNYTKSNNIFNIDKSTLTTDKLIKLHTEATRAEAERMLKYSLYQEVQQGRVEQLPEAFSDSKLNELKKKLSELVTQAAQLDVKFGGRNPKVQEIRQQATAVEEQMKAILVSLEVKMKADYERAQRDEEMMKAALGQAKADAVQENQAAIQFNLLRQNVDTTKGLYNDFLQKTTQAQAQVAEQYNNITLIEPAVIPTGPASPKRSQNLMLAVLLSTVAGIGFALFVDYLDNTIKDANDVSQYAQIPTLAMVPMLTVKGRSLSGTYLATIAKDSPASFLALNAQLYDGSISSTAIESYRILRSSILLSTAGGPPRKILFTSGLPGEGKSTTMINTALSLARLGRSVLIVDADMRRPTAHKVFAVENQLGLSNYLSGKIPLEKVIKPLNVPCLSLLTSGIIPPNAAELVSSESMRNLLAELSRRFDHILIDSPPLASVTDALVISTMVDGVILLVSSGKCTRDVLRYSSQQLRKVDARILGAIINNFDLVHDGYGYYQYRYYANYEAAAADPKDSLKS